MSRGLPGPPRGGAVVPFSAPVTVGVLQGLVSLYGIKWLSMSLVAGLSSAFIF